MNQGRKTAVLKGGLSFGIGLWLIFSALVAYWGNLRYCYELTFLSNFAVGAFFLLTGILLLLDRRVPQFLYLDAAVLLLIVFGVCVAFMSNFSFQGMFVFLHIIDPILVFAFYLFFSEQSETKLRLVPSVLIVPLFYLVFALIFGANTGNHIYFFLDYTQYGVGYTVSFIAGITIGVAMISCLLWRLNRLIHWGHTAKL